MNRAEFEKAANEKLAASGKWATAHPKITAFVITAVIFFGFGIIAAKW